MEARGAWGFTQATVAAMGYAQSGEMAGFVAFDCGGGWCGAHGPNQTLVRRRLGPIRKEDTSDLSPSKPRHLNMQNILSFLQLVFERQMELLNSAGYLISVARDLPASGFLGWGYLAAAFGPVLLALYTFARQLGTHWLASKLPGLGTAALSVAPICVVTLVAQSVRQLG